LFLTEGNIWIVNDVGVQSTNPEICSGELVSNQELSIGSEWLNEFHESWQFFSE
jgi:hypothetical protein